MTDYSEVSAGKGKYLTADTHDNKLVYKSEFITFLKKLENKK